MTLNNFEIKQIIDVASKGINSVLMADPKATTAKLQKVGDFLVGFYRDKIAELKPKEKIIQLDIKKAEKEGKKFQKEILEIKRVEEDSKGEDIEKANLEANLEADKREEEGQKHGPDNIPEKPIIEPINEK